MCAVGNIAERVWWNGPADWTDPVCLDPSTKRHMERASDGRQPSDNVSRTDGVLGTLQSVGSALLESVSSSTASRWTQPPRNQAMRPTPALIPATGDAHANTLSFGRAAMASGHKARDHNESAVRSCCPSARRWCARRRPQGVCPTWRTWSGEDRFSDVRMFQIHVVCVHTSLCSRMCSLRA